MEEQVTVMPHVVESSGPGLLSSVGLIGWLALVVGVAVLVLGLAAWKQRTSRSHALALLVAAAIPYLLGSVGMHMGQIAAQESIVKLGPAITPKDVAAAQRLTLASEAIGTMATVLALCGACAALSRSES